MNETLHYGDAVLVKKSFNSLNTNDIVYFQCPVNDSGIPKTMCLQRLIGLPGDTVEISANGVFINNFRITDTSTVKHNYFLKTGNFKIDSAFVLKYKLTEGGKVSEENDYSFALTEAQLTNLLNDSTVKKIEMNAESKGIFDETVFPHSSQFKWNIDNFGKLFLPKKNDVLMLDTNNLKLYSIIIKAYEKNKIEIKADSIFINDKLSRQYKVQQNYYFVLGDNRDNSRDSRIFGLLPERMIKGKLIKVLKRNH